MITDHHLTGFRTMHAGFRTEFGRLADAFAAPHDETHRLLLEEQLALVLDVLHDHHHHEDEVLWPYLTSCAPDSAAELAALEAEHEHLDPLVRGAADRTRPIAARVACLQELHTFVGAHLDHEERVAFPLMLRHLTPGHIEEDRRNALSDFGRRRIPVVFGWLASCLDDDLYAATLSDQPRLVRLLFRRFWWPSYQRRFTALYGADAVAPAATLARAGAR